MKDSLIHLVLTLMFALMRSKFFEFKEYHNSMDDLKKDNTKIHADPYKLF